MQSKLLRFLQDHEFMRIGGRSFRQADVRVLAATNRDLRAGVRDGWFREDLFYRLNVVPVVIPPLRERHGDIPLLVEHFLCFFRRELGVRLGTVSAEAMELLEAHPWPGNVRELRNLMERAAVLHGDAEILLPEHFRGELPNADSAGALPEAAPGITYPLSLEDEVRRLEVRLIKGALARSDRNLSKAAVLLQTTRRMLKYRIDQYHLSDEI